MTASRDSFRSLAALLAAPALVLGFRIASGLGPGEAGAATGHRQATDEGPAPVPPVHPRASAEQQAALAWLDRIDMIGDISSPIQTGRAIPEAPLVTAPVAEPPLEPGLPPLRLTSVMATRQGGVASINGRIVRVGQPVAPGWTLTAIDAQAGAATITRFDGTVRRLQQPR